MIYLICAKDSKQRACEINDKDGLKTNVYFKYLLDSFEHKNILYPIEFYHQILKEVLPNRVNIVYTNESRIKDINVMNGIVLNNTRDIIKSYKNDIDDVYIFATSLWIIEKFHKLADYVIVFCSDDIGYTLQSLPDLLDFSNYNLIRNEMPENKKYHIEYYVSNKIGK